MVELMSDPITNPIRWTPSGLVALGSLCNHVARIGVGGSPTTPLPSTNLRTDPIVTHFESTLAVGFNYVNIAADNDLTV